MARVVLVAYSGAQTLDIAGPGEVFATAVRQLGARASARERPSRRAAEAPAYSIVLATVDGQPVRTTCGFELRARRLAGLRPRPTDTVLVSGGDEGGVRRAIAEESLVAWVRRASGIVRRIGSVCSGAFVLARAGLLDGRRVATHWSACGRLAAMVPRAKVDQNAIFVQEGRVWTSAGVTTGIDMALAMVEEDHGRALADRVAAHLVLYARRPGFQSQFSEALLAQTDAGDPFAAVLARAKTALRDLDVPRLARLAGLSDRTLHRRCREHLGITPAKLVERLRVEHARTLLSTTAKSLKAIAYETGFTNGERMRRAFERELGVGPRDVRLLFGERLAPASNERVTSPRRAAP